MLTIAVISENDWNVLIANAAHVTSVVLVCATKGEEIRPAMV